MGKQSARMYYQGKDHKDIYFRGSYHNAIVKNKEVVWYKLYENYCITLTGEVIDIKNRKVVIDGIADVMQCDNGTLMGVRNDNDESMKVFLSTGMVYWKKIATINAEGYTLHEYYRQRCPRNSIVYEKADGNKLYLKILKYDGEKIVEKNVKINLESDYLSSYFYTDSTFVNNSDYYYVAEKVDNQYIVHIVLDDGSVKKISYYTEIHGAENYSYSYTSGYIIYAHYNGIVYFFQTYVNKDHEHDRFAYASADLIGVNTEGTLSKVGNAGGSYGYYAYYSYMYLQPLSFKVLAADLSTEKGFVLYAPGADNYFVNDKNTGGSAVVSFFESYPLYDRNGKQISRIKFTDFTVGGKEPIRYQGIIVTKKNELDRYYNIIQINSNLLILVKYKDFAMNEYVINLSKLDVED